VDKLVASVVRSLVIDFDGTICPQDVSEELLDAFAPGEWWDIDLEFQEGRIGARECLVRQAALLRTGRSELIDYAVTRFDLEPTFPPFVAWARRSGMDLAIASDGLGIYVEPMLKRAGVEGVAVLSNDASDSVGGVRLHFPAAHPLCVGCGVCKMNAVLAQRERAGPVGFVGEGHTDRYGALYSDVVFAKKWLQGICRDDGVPFFEWETFDDVRAVLERLDRLPGPVAPMLCPGWTLRSD
jgi:2-hydroxy-3-keto-5-methylthiopentenyl-1-phosphate phosphatase